MERGDSCHDSAPSSTKCFESHPSLTSNSRDDLPPESGPALRHSWLQTAADKIWSSSTRSRSPLGRVFSRPPSPARQSRVLHHRASASDVLSSGSLSQQRRGDVDAGDASSTYTPLSSRASSCSANSSVSGSFRGSTISILASGIHKVRRGYDRLKVTSGARESVDESGKDESKAVGQRMGEGAEGNETEARRLQLLRLQDWHQPRFHRQIEEDRAEASALAKDAQVHLSEGNTNAPQSTKVNTAQPSRCDIAAQTLPVSPQAMRTDVPGARASGGSPTFTISSPQMAAAAPCQNGKEAGLVPGLVASSDVVPKGTSLGSLEPAVQVVPTAGTACDGTPADLPSSPPASRLRASLVLGLSPFGSVSASRNCGSGPNSPTVGSRRASPRTSPVRDKFISLPVVPPRSSSPSPTFSWNDPSGSPAASMAAQEFGLSPVQRGGDDWEELDVPVELQEGTTLLKVTSKKVQQRVFRLDADRGEIRWESKKGNRINIDSIKEVRIGSEARSYRLTLKIAHEHEQRWISIIYQTMGVYKALHLIALSPATFIAWRDTLTRLTGLRRDLMGGLGMLQRRQHVWLRQHWSQADESDDQKLDLDEIVKLCRRLGIQSSTEDLQRLFTTADRRKRGYLDFENFQYFVKLLKRRTEVERVFRDVSDATWPRCAHREPAREGQHGGKRQGSDDFKVGDAIEAIGDGQGEEPAMTFEGFRTFVKEVQFCHEASGAWLHAVFNKFSTALPNCPPCEHGPMTLRMEEERNKLLTLEGFTGFLLSSDNLLLRDSQTASHQQGGAPTRWSSSSERGYEGKNGYNVSHDMTRPLSEYYISSSHNTYLVGNQWKGDSTVEGYIRALQQGCRSVELDCWDGPNNQPQITHGLTLTSKVPFADVMVAVARYAFVASPYPLILSLEVHCDIEQQDRMAEILKETLGDALVTGLLEGRSGKEGLLPSPEELKGRVLVKAKNLQRQASVGDGDAKMALAEPTEMTTTSPEVTESETDHGKSLFNAKRLMRTARKRLQRSPSSSELDRSGREDARPEFPPPGSHPDASATSLAFESSEATLASDVAVSSAQQTSRGQQRGKVLMSTALASLLVYTVGVKYRGFNKKETYAVENVISLSEKTATKLIKSSSGSGAHELAKHNRTHLTRVYPSLSLNRLGSSNYVPTNFWAAGCQLVALNWQTMDLGFELNQAMFARNGRCGYVLKPEALRIKDTCKEKDSPPRPLRYLLNIKIMSAQQLPRFKGVAKEKETGSGEVINPFVAVTVYTPPMWGEQPSLADVTLSSQNCPPYPGKTGSKNPSQDQIAPNVASPTGPLSTTPTRRVQSSFTSLLGTSSPSFTSAASTSSHQSEGEALAPLLLSPPQGSALTSTAGMGVGSTSCPRPRPPRSLSQQSIASVASTSTSASASAPGTGSASMPGSVSALAAASSNNLTVASAAQAGRTVRLRTRTVKGNGFNPVWEEVLSIPLEVPASASASGLEGCASTSTPADPSRGLLDLCFVRFEVCEEDALTGRSLAGYCISLGSMGLGYRHVALYDSQLSQYLFSTLFIHTDLRLV